MEQVSVLPRKALRSDQTVWVNEDNQLRIYPVEILFREQHELLVRGLPDNTLVILSELSTPIPNMPVISESLFDEHPRRKKNHCLDGFEQRSR